MLKVVSILFLPFKAPCNLPRMRMHSIRNFNLPSIRELGLGEQNHIGFHFRSEPGSLDTFGFSESISGPNTRAFNDPSTVGSLALYTPYATD